MKNVFFFWEGGSLPHMYSKNIRYTQILNDGYDVQLVDSSSAFDVIAERFPKLASIFPSIHIPAVKSDIIRMALLYKFGGWYLDCDTSLRVGLDYWHEKGKTLFLKWVDANNKISIQNSFIGGEKGHPFFLKCLGVFDQVLTEKIHHFSVYKSTGPDAVLNCATSFIKADETSFTRMDYQLIDVIKGDTKGSWTFQENCGIWANDENPARFNANVALDRIESLDAFEFYKRIFDRYPQTKQENYKKLLVRAGVHYVHKHRIADEVLSLSGANVPVKGNEEFYKRLREKLTEQGDNKNVEAVERIASAA